MKLVRFRSDDEGTFGVLVLVNQTVLFTGELPDKSNQRNISCIPTGTYLVKQVQSSSFGLVYEVKNVPGRTDIYLHNGNYAGDAEKGFRSDVEGCILLGMDIGELDNQRVVLSSQLARGIFEGVMGDEPGILTITNAKF